ncbi:MAG: carboxylesterase family protein [Proteobacteria bacterium]|nr:carboxylesterase family protein [Pseudomonadota bacterium]
MQTVSVICSAGEILGRAKAQALLFAGIPYAQPPVGNLRFKAPQPLRSFSEPYPALKFGPAAPQVPSGGMTDSAPVRWDEDCLTLNISTPTNILATPAKRPVLVWIHGGGYRSGQGAIPWYNGTRFARDQDIVVVSINYRLGALGFADLTHLGDEFTTSNVNGMLDQIAALQWVQRNIDAFGGDPDQVTIAGESAGAFSVGALMGCPAANGLFHRAIAQSGAAQHTLPPEAAQTVGKTFCEHLGQDNAIGLMAASVEEILAAQGSAAAQFESGAGVSNSLGTTVSPFYPVHNTELLPTEPLEAIKNGNAATVTVLIGSNADETTLWSYGKVSEDKLQRIATDYGVTEGLATYRANRPQANAEQLLVALTSDHMFRIPGIRLAEAQLNHTTDVWMYLFNWKSRAFDGRLGATHALEIPFAFNNLDRAGVDAFIGAGVSPQPLADVMHKAWASFIKDGQPGWSNYALTERATMLFDEQSSIVDDPMGDERSVWEGLR